MSRARLVSWTLLVGAVAALNYSAYGSSTGGSGDEIYQYSTFENGVVFYGVVLGLALLIAVDRFDLLALRRPRAFLRAGGIGAAVVISILVLEYVVTKLPVENPGKEQGLTPTRWESAHAGAFAANVVLFCAVAPFVEETLFRGLGYSLLRDAFGVAPAILVVGLAFGAWHGLLVALLILIPFGWALAYLRERTDSVFPGMVVHALFNGAAIAASVLS